ncbi:MAG: ABC transporter permease [Patescibacteria group bacterium]
MSLANRNLKELFRDPLAIGLGVAMPIGFLALFISIQKRLPLEMFTAPVLTPGITVFSFAFLMMFSGTMLVKDRYSAFLTRLLATPLKPVDYILAYILPFISIALLQIAACFGAGALLGFHLDIHVLTSLLILLPAALIFIGLGMLLGSLCTENQVPGFGSILITGTSLFSGAWMDLKAVGGIFAGIGYALPSRTPSTPPGPLSKAPGSAAS